tara:strand:+ start:192 stop:560 length:369 start_codon:yes stop_codon:yes gene_type:complete
MDINVVIGVTVSTRSIKTLCYVGQPLLLQRLSPDTLDVLISTPKILGLIPRPLKVIGYADERSAKRMSKLEATGETFSGKIQYLRTHHVSRDWNYGRDNNDYDDAWDDYVPRVQIAFTSETS